MSFARAKINRFNDKSAVKRPTTAASIGGVPQSSSQKSFIPKFRSLSQPPSVHCINDGANIGDHAKTTSSKPPIFDTVQEIESTIAKSAKSDVFKDCQGSKHELDIQNESKKSESPKVVKKNEIKSESPSIVRREGMIRRNSSSGIPIPSSMKITPRLSPQPSPKPSIIKRQNTNLTLMSEKNNNRRNFELFIAKKRRLDIMKKEIADKQKPLLDLYQALQQLKKKINETGKSVTLEAIKIVEYDETGPKVRPKSEEGDTALKTPIKLIELDVNIINNMKTTIKQIPQGFLEVCKNLNDKRNALVVLLEKNFDPAANKDEVQQEFLTLKEDSIDIDSKVNKLISDQEQIANNLITKWSHFMSLDQASSRDLQAKLNKVESQLKDVTDELQATKHQLREAHDKKGEVVVHESGDSVKLKDKIVQLEKQLESERKKQQVEAEKFKSAEQSIRTFKAKIKDFDHSKQQYDNRISQLSQDLRTSQLKLKQMEKNYEKEITELNKSRHLDKSVIERLNKDRQTFETRLHAATETIDNVKKEAQERETELHKELVEVRNDLELAQNEMHNFKKECENLQKHIQALEVHTQQAADIIHHEREHSPERKDKETDHECELQIEIVAQKATIKSLQEKVEANIAEKLRFIETIEKLSGNNDQMNDAIVKTLVKKEEDISKFLQVIKNNEGTIEALKSEVRTMHEKEEHLSEQLACMSLEGNTEELKQLLKEGKYKLEHAMMKTVENEHKIVKYEQELAQKTQAIGNLENMLKVRDGLMGVIKAKKDELAMENYSLTKYSEEIRQYVLETKEHLKEKSEIISELQTSINSKDRERYTLEKKVKDLEQKLTVTNEKRYKLQDTVSFMEKEIQASKAQASQHDDMQTRYDLGRLSSVSNTKTNNSTHLPWRAASELLRNEYKMAYEREQKKKSKSFYNIHTNQSQKYYVHEIPDISGDSSTNDQNSVTLLNMNSVSHFISEYEEDFDEELPVTNKVQSLPVFNNPPENEILGAGQEYKPILFDGVDSYKVMQNGNLLWCTPSAQMRSNNMLITRDIIAHTCSNIRSKLDNSLEFINYNRVQRM